jgi:uncharacterized membrane protein
VTEAAGSADDEGQAQDAEQDGRGWTTEPGRLFALTDGVFAIAMTLLALDVRIADNLPDTRAGFRAGFGDLAGQYGVFILAFFITAQFWMSNHEILRRLKRVDHKTLWYTVRFLAGICSLPVAATLLTRYASVLPALALAAGLLALVNLLHLVLFWYVTEPDRGLSAPMDREDRFDGLLVLIWNPVLFLAAIPLAALLNALDSGKGGYACFLWFGLRWTGAFVWLVRKVMGRSRRGFPLFSR